MFQHKLTISIDDITRTHTQMRKSPRGEKESRKKRGETESKKSKNKINK